MSLRRANCLVELSSVGDHLDAVVQHSTCSPVLTRNTALQGNFSDFLVMLSNIYSKLRGDVSGVKNEDSAQGFVRSTTKYWVRTTDISAVKHHILQHLPVFQYNEGSVGCFPNP